MEPPLARPDIKLIVADMDGTLLDSAHRMPVGFRAALGEMKRRGIQFCPASGRQYYSLLREFGDMAVDLVFIAENGTLVMAQDTEISSDTLPLNDAHRLVRSVRAAVASGADAGIVVCGKKSAYVERNDAPFRVEVDRYYARLEVVDNLEEVADDEMLKVAIFDFGHIEDTIVPALALAEFRRTHQVAVSGHHWVDVMSTSANKGTAVRNLQRTMGIGPENTMVFGDYLNDLQMMSTADYSYAMAQAHPDLIAAARFRAPSNDENGVLQTVSAILGPPWPGPR